MKIRFPLRHAVAAVLAISVALFFFEHYTSRASRGVLGYKVVHFPAPISGRAEIVDLMPGDLVSPASLIATVTDDSVDNKVNTLANKLEQARILVKKRREEVSNASAQFEQARQLLEDGFISKMQFNDVKLALSDRHAELEMALAEFNRFMDLKKKNIERFSGLVKASLPTDIQQMGSGGLVDIQQQPIIAAQAGRIYKMDVASGGYVEAGKVIGTMLDCRRPVITITVPARLYDELKIGTDTKIKIAGFDEKFSGKVISMTAGNVDTSSFAPTILPDLRKGSGVADVGNVVVAVNDSNELLLKTCQFGNYAKIDFSP